MTNKTFLLNLLSVIILAGAGMASTVLVSRLLGPLPLSINSTVSQKQNLFTSTGESEIVTVPDQVGVTLGVNVNSPTVGSAQADANNVINSISENLKELGIKSEDIKTQNYSIYPDYDYNSGTQRIRGYIVNANLLVKLTDFNQLNTVIDMATAQGANQVGGINFSLSKEKEAELKKQARKEAIADAKESAEELARLGGVRLGKVVDVYESQGSMPAPKYARELSVMSADAMGGETAIEPGSATYNYTVTLSYETL